MKYVMKCWGFDSFVLKLVLSLLIFSATVGVKVNAAEADPAQFAEGVKNNLIAIIKEKEKYESEKSIEAYYSAVEDVLEPVVDFDFIARAVMNNFYKDATVEQRQKFTEVFKRGLVTTYANGMAGFVDYEMTIIPPKDTGGDKKRVSVGLEVRGGGSVNRVSFSLRKDEESWKLINMILNGTNFGSLMQKQFAQAMSKSNNNIDQVIAGWTGA